MVLTLIVHSQGVGPGYKYIRTTVNGISSKYVERGVGSLIWKGKVGYKMNWGPSVENAVFMFEVKKKIKTGQW